MSDAYEVARQYLSHGKGLLDIGGPLVKQTDRETIIHDLGYGRAIACAYPDQAIMTPLHLRRFDFVALLMLTWDASEDLVAWSACEQLAAAFCKADAPLPYPLATFAAKLLAGKVQKPTPKPGRNPYTNYYRNMVIAAAVRAALRADSDLKPYRNDESTTTTSACDVVAACLQELGVRALKYENVKDIYKKAESADSARIN